MSHEESYALNRAHWDGRAEAHARSDDYGVRRLAADPGRLSDIVRFDLPRLGDVRGLRGVHLQCHIGTDTLSLARLGATMTGLDFSGESIRQARRISAEVGTPVTYVQAGVYEALDFLEPGTFDLVYTGIGALCWLPSIDRWAGVVAGLLRPGGRLFIREGHPVLWSIDDEQADRLVVGFPYFEEPTPTAWTTVGTYVKTDVDLGPSPTHDWNHGLGEIVAALLAHGMRITALEEHRSVPWEALPGQMTRDDDEWRLTEHPERLPLTYTLQAVREG